MIQDQTRGGKAVGKLGGSAFRATRRRLLPFSLVADISLYTAIYIHPGVPIGPDPLERGLKRKASRWLRIFSQGPVLVDALSRL